MNFIIWGKSKYFISDFECKTPSVQRVYQVIEC